MPQHGSSGRRLASRREGILVNDTASALESFWQALNWVDFVLILGLIAALLVGLAMGFYRQLVLLASVVVGFLVASQFTQPLAASEAFDAVRARYGLAGAEVASYASLVLGCTAVGLLVVLIFRSFFHRTVRFLDSVLGGGLGTLVGGLACGLVILGLFSWHETWLHQPVRTSYVGSRLAEGARLASAIFPEEFRQRVESGLAERIAIVAGEEPAPVAPGPPAIR